MTRMRPFPLRDRGGGATALSTRPPGTRREVDGEGGPGAPVVLDLDVTAVAADDGVDRRQPEAGAVRLGREVGVEHPRALLDRDAGAAIRDRDAHVRSWRQRKARSLAQGQVGRPQRDLAAPGHRLVGVEHQVADGLIELALIHLRRPELLRQLEAQGGGRAGQDEARRLLQERPQLGETAQGCTAPGEPQELAGQALGTQQRRLGTLEERLRRVVARQSASRPGRCCPGPPRGCC